MAILTRGGSPIRGKSGGLKRKHAAEAPNDEDFGLVAIRFVREGTRGRWYAWVSQLPAGVTEARLVVFRRANDRKRAYHTPVVTLTAGEWVLMGPGADDRPPDGPMRVGVEAVVDGVPGRAKALWSVGLLEDPPSEDPALGDPAAPGLVSYSVATGSGDGEIDLTLAVPDPGDGEEVGDGLGGALTYEYRLDGGEEIDGGALDAGVDVITAPALETSYDVEVRALSAFRAGPWGPALQVVSGGTMPVEPVPPVWLNPAPLSLEAGEALAIDWTDHFTGATSFDVLSGLTGGVESGASNELYDVADLVVEEVSIHVTATNAEGTTTAFWPVSVVTPGVAPSLISPIPDVIVPQGASTTVSRDVTQHFTGTNLVYSSAQSTADVEVTAAGEIRSLHALTDPITAFPMTIVATNSLGSAQDTITVEVTAAQPTALTADDVSVYEAYETAPGWRTPRIQFPGQSPASWFRIDWSTGIPDANGVIAADQIEEGGVYLLSTGVYGIRMADPAKRNDAMTNNPRTDFAKFGSTEARADKLRIRYVETEGGLPAGWSSEFSVPQIEVALPTARIALPLIMNTPGQYAANLVGSPGMQFKPNIFWNEGVGDVDQLLTAFAGQDEHFLDVTRDGGRTWAPARIWGGFCARIYGGYANSDDDVLTFYGGTAGEVGDISAGIYVGPYFKDQPGRRHTQHINVKEGTRQAFQSWNAGRINHNLVHRRPNPARNISDANRPFFFCEIVLGAGARLWRVVDPAVASQWEIVKSWTEAESRYTGTQGFGPQVMFGVKVAPNGDVVVWGGKGVWVCENPLAASPTFTKKFDGYVRGFDLIGGSATTPSGAYLGIGESDGFLRYTSNIRLSGSGQAQAFANPGRTGLPNGYRIGHVSAAHGKIWVNKHAGPGGAYVSGTGTPGTLSFSSVPSNRMTDPWANFAYGWLGRHCGIYPCPHNVTLPDGRRTRDYAIAMVQQTLSVSVDGGLTFNGNLCEFYDHGHSRSFMHDRTNVNLMCMVQQDRSAQISTSAAGALAWVASGATKGISVPNQAGVTKTLAAHFTDGGLTGDVTSGSVGVIGDIGATGRKRIIAFLTGATGDGTRLPVIIEPHTDGDFTTSGGAFKGTGRAITNQGNSRARRGFYHPTVTDQAIVGKWLIDNIDAADKANISFSIPSGAANERECIGIQNDSGTIRSYWITRGSDSNKVYMSEQANCGGQTLFATTPNVFYECAIASDPFVPKRLIYVRKTDMVVRAITEAGETSLFDLRPLFNSVMSAHGVDMGAVGFRMRTPQIGYVFADPNMQNLFYCLVKSGVGMPQLFRSVPGSSPLQFEDFTNDLPLANQFGFLHPDTGDVITTGSMGASIVPPPTVAQGYPTLGGNRAKHWTDVAAYFGRAAVTNIPEG